MFIKYECVMWKTQGKKVNVFMFVLSFFAIKKKILDVSFYFTVYKNDKQSIQYLIFMNDVMKMFIAISELVFLIIHQVNIS